MTQPSPRGGSTPAVAVAVVSYNTRELLIQCLHSLADPARRGVAEVWVVDNGSSDGSPEAVAQKFPWVRLIADGVNRGFGPAVNLVAAQTDTEWVAPANADIELRPEALERMLDAAMKHPDAGAIAPRLLLADESTQHSVYAFPTIPYTVALNLGLYRVLPGLGDRLCFEGMWNADRPRYVDWAIGALLLVRRAAWTQVRGFDERQWMYAEDVDLGWRLDQAGWRTWYEPMAMVRHHASASTAQAWGDERRTRWMISTYAWMLRRRGLLRTRATALVNVLGALVRVALFALLSKLGWRRFGYWSHVSIEWARLHRRAGFAARAELRQHR